MVEGRRLMKKNGVSGLLALLVLLYGAQTGAQQEPAWPSYRYLHEPGSVPAPLLLTDRSSYANPWGNRPRPQPRRGTTRRYGSGMGNSRTEPGQMARPGQVRRTYQVQQPAQTPTLPPRVEASINEINPYEQQSLIYLVRIISGGNLKSVSPELPAADSVVVRQLGDPVTSSEMSGSRTIFTTEYRYLLMPLAAGLVEIPPAVASGVMTSAAGGDPSVRMVAKKSLVLDVQPAVQAVQPWLPLHQLQIDARILDKEQLVAGDPVQLEVEISATGATGGQIPSLASQLGSPDFRIYPGKSFTAGKLSVDGSSIRGRRVETFTLVPQHGGWLKIPNLSLNWWNVRYKRPEVASLLMDRIKVEGPRGPAPRGATGRGSSGVFGEGGLLIWVPLMIAVGILLYGWVNAFVGPGRMPGSARIIGLARSMLGELYAPLAALGMRISPRRRFHRLRAWIGRNLPVSWKLWFCLRAVAREDDPDAWGHALQILATKHLGVRPQTNLNQLGNSIAACHPRANGRQVSQLMDELNAAIYGNGSIRSFQRWKREFERQIRPGLFPLRLRNGRPRRQSRRLPELNPGRNTVIPPPAGD